MTLVRLKCNHLAWVPWPCARVGMSVGCPGADNARGNVTETNCGEQSVVEVYVQREAVAS